MTYNVSSGTLNSTIPYLTVSDVNIITKVKTMTKRDKIKF